MNKALTLEQILLYAWGEPCDMSDDVVIESLLSSDEPLNDEFELLYYTRQLIEKSMVNPPDSVINKIFAYSEALAIINLSEPDLRTMIKN